MSEKAPRIRAGRILFTGMSAVIALGLSATRAADSSARPGEPADLASSAYQYRADRAAEENSPESWILLMQYAGLPFDRPVDPNAPAIKQVLRALQWEGVRPVRNVELSWTGDRVPPPNEVAVVYLDTSVRGIHTWWNRQAPTREAELRATNGRT